MRFRKPVYNVYRLDCLNRLDGGVCTLVRDCYKVGRLVKDFFHLLAPCTNQDTLTRSSFAQFTDPQIQP